MTKAATDLPAHMVETWRRIAPRMAELGICNPALGVYATGFRAWSGYDVGIVLTPWFMNVVAVPNRETSLPAQGGKAGLVFPAGEVEFTAGSIEGIGPVLVSSLYSPMDAFTGMDVAVRVAETALDVLFRPPAANLDETPKRLSRRTFVMADFSGTGMP